MTPNQSILLDPLLPQEMLSRFCLLIYEPHGLGPLSLSSKAKLHLRNRRDNAEFRVQYMTHLRSIISRPGRVPEIPRNKLGVALVSDYDCLDANLAEQIEAILRSERFWEEAKQ